MIQIDISKHLWTANGDHTLKVNIKIPKGKIVAFYGNSGTGKTTLLRSIAGLTDPDSGNILVNNIPWFNKANKTNLPANKRQVGFVFQDYGLFPNMTVYENIRFAQDQKDPDHIRYLVKMFGLEGLKDRRPNVLSGGQQQRVALARAIAKKPDILLLDEPLSALDNKTRCSLQDQIKEINAKWGTTIIIVSHDVSEIFKLSSLVYQFKDDKVEEIGDPANIFSNNQISGKVQFIGEVLDCQQEDIIQILTLLVGSTPVKIVLSNPEDKYIPGDKVLVVSKAFSPIVEKLK